MLGSQLERTIMGAGCTKEAKAGVVDLQNGNVAATPRTPTKTNLKMEGDQSQSILNLLPIYLSLWDVVVLIIDAKTV